MTTGSWKHDDLSNHVRECTLCGDRIRGLPGPADPASVIQTSELCRFGASYYVTWWEWCREKPYPKEAIRPRSESPAPRWTEAKQSAISLLDSMTRPR